MIEVVVASESRTRPNYVEKPTTHAIVAAGKRLVPLFSFP
jgi:hypothetical protein